MKGGTPGKGTVGKKVDAAKLEAMAKQAAKDQETIKELKAQLKKVRLYH